MRIAAWVLAATLATTTVARGENVAPGATETAYITDQLRVALRAEANAEADPVAMLTSGAALTVLARDARMVRVRAEQGEGWIDARYLVAEPPAATQLVAARAQLEQLHSSSIRPRARSPSRPRAPPTWSEEARRPRRPRPLGRCRRPLFGSPGSHPRLLCLGWDFSPVWPASGATIANAWAE